MRSVITSSRNRTVIKKCHSCGHVMESRTEVQKCGQCKKSFLPTNYHNKITAKNSLEFYDQFQEAEELSEELLVKGIQVLW
ncbi:MAG: hypothetical protein ACO20H_12835 [Bacteriovoracaceae bacterium]